MGFFSEYINGANAYIKKINSEGGVFGRRIELLSYDDQYDPEKTVYYTQKLINDDKVFALLNYVGTPTGTKIVPIVEEAKIPLVGIGSGAQIFREPLKEYIYNLRPSYHQEADAFISGIVEELGIKKIAIFYQYDAYGFDGLKGAEISLERYGLKPTAIASYERGSLDVGGALATIKDSGAEAVFIVGVYGPTAEFIKQARAQNFNPIFGNLSFTGSEALAKELGADGNGVVVMQVVPPPTEKNLLIGVDDYINDLNASLPGHEATFSGLEGYADAEVFVEGLKRAGKELTRENFMNGLESIEKYDLGLASPVNFSATQHQGMQRVYATYLRDEKFVLFRDWKTAEFNVKKEEMQ
ncbi:MAG: hypothetical protein ACD_67C00028G0002 [uncultured bacterium]|nr:MAG: hypothetical protein ACD_67C00028G0002 [uncultured bacterium]